MSRGAEVLARLEAQGTTVEPPAPEPEEPVVDPPAEGEEPAADPAAPTDPAPAPVEEKQKFAPQFAALAKREARVTRMEREGRAALARERADFERERLSLDPDRKEIAEFKTALKDPEKFMAFAHRRGMTGEQLAAYYAGEGSKDNATAASIRELREELAAEKQARKEEDEARRRSGHQQTAQAVESQFITLARDEAAYPYANAVYDPREILAVAKEELQLAAHEGIDISSIPDSEVMRAVEARAKAKADRLAKLQQSPGASAAIAAPVRSTSGANANGARTLTNGQAAAATSPRVTAQTREERIAQIKRRLG